ncbi:MAG: glutamate synthase [Telmatospirillum sp.]|nr:glutamate synthase [Telmatospirillum sp.]
MVDLTPLPFPVLVTRLFQGMERKGAIFDYPLRRMVTGAPGRDLSVSVHGHRASSPFGPAAGPHTQLAQNIVLAWLAGGRVMELKTVQVKDDLVIPRPCIDMRTVGFNVEWSQELTLAQSLEEYVKAAMLIDMAKAAGLAPGFGDTVFDMSVGYDLAGIRSAKVRAFLTGLMDAGPVIDRLRREIPEPYARFRDLPYATRISDTLTLSTFHGCPPAEIEDIGRFLLETIGVHLVVKLNPTLLGRADLHAILHDRLGYSDIEVPDSAFEQDATWDEMTGIIDRLGLLADRLGRGFGVKFSNTLLVRNNRGFLPPSEAAMYLSGTPLHVLAITLVRRFRDVFGDRFPISFSAGIDAGNFADAVALGLKPVSVCSDLLKVGGYARAQRYVDALAERMAAVDAPDIDSFVLKAHGQALAALQDAGLPPDRDRACRDARGTGGDLRAAAGDDFPAWGGAARIRNTAVYEAEVAGAPRYHAAENAIPPKKTGTRLQLFDCLSCDKCIALCPNDAIFSLPIGPADAPARRLRQQDGAWVAEETGALRLTRPHQIGILAEACNECGNCDVMCPEDGAPYRSKPLFFVSAVAFRASARDGFCFEVDSEGVHMLGRIGGMSVRLGPAKGEPRRSRCQGPDFDLSLDPSGSGLPFDGFAEGPVDLTPFMIMDRLRDGVTAPGAENALSAAIELAEAGLPRQ